MISITPGTIYGYEQQIIQEVEIINITNFASLSHESEQRAYMQRMRLWPQKMYRRALHRRNTLVKDRDRIVSEFREEVERHALQLANVRKRVEALINNGWTSLDEASARREHVDAIRIALDECLDVAGHIDGNEKLLKWKPETLSA